MKFSDLAEDFIVKSRSVTVDKQLACLLAEVTGDMGFEWYSVAQQTFSPVDGQASKVLTNFKSGQSNCIPGFGFYQDDPAVLAGERTCVGFKLSDVKKLISLDDCQRAALTRTHEEGVSDAFSVPAHVPGRVGGLATFAVSRGRSLPREMLPTAQLVGLVAWETFQRLTSKRSRDPRDKLTHRQVECIRLVACGKSNREIAANLEIKEDTVAEYLDNARQRLGVDRRCQLVVRALYDGLIAFSEVLHKTRSMQ